MTGQSPEDTCLSVHTNSQSLSVNQNSHVGKKKDSALFLQTRHSLREDQISTILKKKSLPAKSLIFKL